VVAFTPAEWKLRYYLLPSLPALALIAAPTAVRLVGARPRRPGQRAAVALAAGALAAGALGLTLVAVRPFTLSASDQSTVAALLAVVPGRAAGVTAAAGFAAGVVIVGAAWRAWSLLVGLVAAGALAWMALGVPALEAAISRRDSLKPFAQAVAARYPASAPLAFLGRPIRPVAVYVGRPVPTRRRREGFPPGLALIAPDSAYRDVVAAGTEARAVLAAEGRVGNLARTRVVLFEIPPGS
jgi:hypothetical protein